MISQINTSMNPYRENYRPKSWEFLNLKGDVLWNFKMTLDELSQQKNLKMDFLKNSLSLNIKPIDIVFATTDGAIFCYYPYDTDNELRWINEDENNYYLLVFTKKGQFKQIKIISKEKAKLLPYPKKY